MTTENHILVSTKDSNVSDGISGVLNSGPLVGRKILIIVENLPVPFDRRVWQEAKTLRRAGAEVSVICPTGKGHTSKYENIDGINVYRHQLPIDANGALGYALEYSAALYWEVWLAFRVLRKHGFDVIHACNPPDLIFLVALLFKPFGKKFLFDHHDINPELYEAKFGKRDFFYKVMLWAEKATFWLADVSIATNNSYRQLAIQRGGMHPEDVFVVRSGPDLSKLVNTSPNARWKNGREYLIGYVGVMGQQEGIDLLLQSIEYIVRDLGRSDVQFCLVGGGPSLADLILQCDRMGLSDFVTFTGRISDHDLFEVLSTADVCVNPDRVNAMNDKSTMNKVLEYMAFGKAQVQFEVTEGRYSAADSSLYAKANDVRDFAEKILELLADPEEAKRMGEVGRRRVDTMFSWDHQVPALVAAYQRVFSKS